MRRGRTSTIEQIIDCVTPDDSGQSIAGDYYVDRLIESAKEYADRKYDTISICDHFLGIGLLLAEAEHDDGFIQGFSYALRLMMEVNKPLGPSQKELKERFNLLTAPVRQCDVEPEKKKIPSLPNDIVKQIESMDSVELEAIAIIMRGMLDGNSEEQSLEACNIYLASNGRKPIPSLAEMEKAHEGTDIYSQREIDEDVDHAKN